MSKKPYRGRLKGPERTPTTLRLLDDTYRHLRTLAVMRKTTMAGVIDQLVTAAI